MLFFHRFSSLFITLSLCGCSDFFRSDSLHPHKDTRDLKNIVTPVKSTERNPTEQFTPFKYKRKAEHIPKALQKPVSIIIDENTPLKEVFIALAEQANIELQLDPTIEGKIIYTAHKKPFYDVIKNICKIVKLRFILDGTSIRIEPNNIYNQNYNLQFLNIERKSQNRISIATDVFNSINLSENNKANADNSSSSEVKMTTENSFWKEIENNIKVILGNDAKNTKYTIHKQAGLISVHATQAQHEIIEEYIERIKHITSRQVLIEAKIVEVNLKDSFKSGIDWSAFNNNLTAGFASFSQEAHFSSALKKSDNFIGLRGNSGQFKGMLQALEEFGSSRTLSSPRLTVMNNQIAILKVAQNKVYFKLNYDKQFSSSSDFKNISVSSDIQTVPIGLVMSVQPSIDEETGDIILCLRPTVSKLANTEADPAVAIAFANTDSTDIKHKESLVPVVDVKEIDSILRVKSGEIAILGGLMEVKTTKDSAGVPGFKDVPFIKDIFSSQNDAGEVVELVILLKATIVDQSKPHQADKRLFKDYVTDTRSLN